MVSHAFYTPLFLNLSNVHPTGRVLIGKEEVEMDSVGEEVSLWEKMMQYPDSWAEGTLPLRSTMKKGNWGQARTYLLTIPWLKWGETEKRDCGWIFLSAVQTGRFSWEARQAAETLLLQITVDFKLHSLQGMQIAASQIPVPMANRIMHFFCIMST